MANVVASAPCGGRVDFTARMAFLYAAAVCRERQEYSLAEIDREMRLRMEGRAHDAEDHGTG